MADVAHASNNVVYIHGRSWGSWTAYTAYVADDGWNNHTYSFNGNAKLNGSETNTTVRNAIASYCSGGNTCIVVCYSAGCLRMKKAISDLRASGNTLPGLLYTEGAGDASGGTELAELATQGWTSIVAKIIGQQEAIDKDLTPSAARGTWGYVQDDIGVNHWLVAGNKNVCKKLLFWKICANKYLSGNGDGVVPFHSSGGYSSASAKTTLCSVSSYNERTASQVSGKYPNHRLDTTDYGSATQGCGGKSYDHFGIVNVATGFVEADIDGAAAWSVKSWGDNTGSLGDCAGANCDQAFQDTSADFSNEPDGTSVATDVSGSSSETTGNTDDFGGSCFGHCGGRGSSGTCWCDSVCSSYGDCCGDYGPAHCADVNN